jgi:protein-S-isoprenylcysteine O-methyltransferase Ste14
MHEDAAIAGPRPGPLLVVPPPLLFAAAFAAGALFQHFVPFPRAAMPSDIFLGGAAIMVAGLGFGLSLAAGFLTRRTTLKPFADPAVLVARGAYRFSRNPMYLSLIVSYLGGTLMMGSLWPLVLLAVPVAVMARVVIPFEEGRMQATFGAGYRDYRARVRRWF